MHDFWQLTDEDKAKMKAEYEKRKAEMEARKQKQTKHFVLKQSTLLF